MKSFIAEKSRKLSKLALYHLEDLSYSAFMRALRKKDVKVNGKRVGDDVLLNVGDKVEIFYVEQKKEKFNLIYQDENILIINKKRGYNSESVFEEIKSIYYDARFVHRLDRNTDGIMVFALNDESERLLLDGFKKRTFVKKYYALVKGKPKKEQAVLTAYLIKDSQTSTVKIFDNKIDGAVLIKTGYKVLESDGKTSLLEVELFTGKTHQIRAHLAHIGHPIIGDGKYGDFDLNEKMKETSQRLTAVSLQLKFGEGTKLFYLNDKTFSLGKKQKE